MFMETRNEWLLAAHGLLRIGATIGTLYATLGDEGIVFGANQLEASHIITSSALLPKVMKLAPQIKKLTTVIYALPHNKKAPSLNNNTELKLVSYDEVERAGTTQNTDVAAIKVDENDTAIIMFTSGSTGTPKGVVLTHKNVIACMNSLNTPVSKWNLQSKRSTFNIR